MKLAFGSGALLFAVAGIAVAETFTFESTSTTVNTINVATGPSSAIGAGFSEGESKVSWGSGATTTTKNTCAAWSAAPSSGFTTQGVCNFSEGANEQASIQYSCQGDAAMGAANCWGALRGVAGQRAGKSGTIAWRQVANPDGNTGRAMGTGMWND
jgi:hypothetical protein